MIQIFLSVVELTAVVILPNLFQPYTRTYTVTIQTTLTGELSLMKLREEVVKSCLELTLDSDCNHDASLASLEGKKGSEGCENLIGSGNQVYTVFCVAFSQPQQLQWLLFCICRYYHEHYVLTIHVNGSKQN